jgi:hypothetical protein
MTPLVRWYTGQVPWNNSETNLAFKYGFLIYSEFVRKVMERVITSLPTAEIMISGTWLILLSGQNVREELGGTDVMMKLKFETMSSRTYSGRNLKASAASDGSGRLRTVRSL